MHVFLLVIIPLVYLVNEYICQERKIDRDQIVCIFSGIVIACVYTLIDFFVVGKNHQWVYRISSVWGHYLFTETVLPVAICVLPVMLAKDSIRVKIRFLFPVLVSFYAIFMPYKIISEAAEPDFFTMIIYPMMMAATLFNIETAAGLFEEGRDVKKLFWLRIAVAFVAVFSGLLLPSLLEAYHFLNKAGAGTYVFSCLFILFSAGLRVVLMLFMPER